MTDFVTIAKDEFAFIRLQHDYELVAEQDHSFGAYVSFVNQDVGVGIKLEYEFRSAYIFVWVYRLVDGEMQDNPSPITDDTEINCFGFDDYLEPAERMKAAYEYEEDSPYFDPQDGLRNFTREFADRLRVHGDRLLRGDLSVLQRMATVIKMRAAELGKDDRD